VAALVVPGVAGPDKIKFPTSWKDHVLYSVVDRHDTKQYRELYASTQAAVDAMKAGKELPNGTVLTLVQYKAQVDAAGAPLKDARGRFVKGDLLAFTVVEKQTGWGSEYPAEWRNGEWEYAVFNPAGVLNDKANYKGCFECHKPHEKMDYVISLAALRGATATTTASRPDVKIAGFAFGPNKHTGPWASRSRGRTRTTRRTRSRSSVPRSARPSSSRARAPLAFNAAGTYEYICGLHPNMKGTVEVK
jgi:hypothetical protein